MSNDRFYEQPDETETEEVELDGLEEEFADDDDGYEEAEENRFDDYHDGDAQDRADYRNEF